MACSRRARCPTRDKAQGRHRPCARVQPLVQCSSHPSFSPLLFVTRNGSFNKRRQSNGYRLRSRHAPRPAPTARIPAPLLPHDLPTPGSPQPPYPSPVMAPFTAISQPCPRCGSHTLVTGCGAPKRLRWCAQRSASTPLSVLSPVATTPMATITTTLAAYWPAGQSDEGKETLV